MLDAGPGDGVVVVQYSSQWPRAYERERAAICRVLGDLIADIQHIGSTAIPGLSAKPVIDILVATPRFAGIEEYARRLGPLGYQYRTHPDENVRIFFRKGLPRTHHLHIVEDGSWEHRRLLLFRDYLLVHPDAAKAYEALKRDLARRFADNRPQYTESKTGFIEAIIALADAENTAQDKGRLVRDACPQ